VRTCKYLRNSLRAMSFPDSNLVTIYEPYFLLNGI
jgi:hypothetical protein